MLYSNDELLNYIQTTKPNNPAYSSKWWELVDSFRSDSIPTEIDRQARWLAVSNLMAGLANKNYATKQIRGDMLDTARQWHQVSTTDKGKAAESRHIDRMLLFVEFLKDNRSTTVYQAVTLWKLRFNEIEFVEREKDRGIAHDVNKQKRPASVDTVWAQRIARTVKMLRDEGLQETEDVVAETLLSCYVLENDGAEPTTSWKSNRLRQIRQYLFTHTNVLELV